MLDQWTARRAGLPKIAILGIGNLLRSDDAAGVLVARQIGICRLIQDLDFFRVWEAGHAPENCTAELRRFAPEVVILIDAAQMEESPGTIRWIDMEDMDGLSASTHSMPLSLLAKYLTLELNCDVKLLGIQPRCNEFGETLSTEVRRAVDEVAQEWLKMVEHLLSGRATCPN
jgi:hydrogenase 3 maturation protease